MSLMTKRALLGVTAAAALTALVGCGKKEEPAPQAGRTGSAAAPRPLPRRRPSR